MQSKREETMAEKETNFYAVSTVGMFDLLPIDHTTTKGTLLNCKYVPVSFRTKHPPSRPKACGDFLRL